MDPDAELLTTGAFARASSLTRKALRLYDELGLLRPAAVDESTGYRYYGRDQLAHATLVAWLRRAGMPLARIRSVCDAGDRAEAIRTWWAEAERDTAARRDLVHGLLSTDDTQEPSMTTLVLDAAATTDRGLVRADDLDRAAAGPTRAPPSPPSCAVASTGSRSCTSVTPAPRCCATVG